MNDSTSSLPRGEQDPRVYMAAERTLLAWVRTGLAMMGFGFVVARFGLFLREIARAAAIAATAAPGPPTAVGGDIGHGGGGASLWIGVVMVVAGVLVNLLAAADHVRVVRALRRGDPHPSTQSGTAVALAVLLTGLGVVMALYLLDLGT